jgi:beta-lactamase regulating signal transducer with metallopeptidase domain
MSITTPFSDLSSVTLAPVVIAALRATALLVLTGLALLLVRRQSASVRHVIIVLGTAGSLGASALAAVGMQWRVEVLPPTPAVWTTDMSPVALAPADVVPVAAPEPFNAARIPDAPVVVDGPGTPDVAVVVDAPVAVDVAAAASPLWTLPSFPVVLGLLWIVGVMALLGHFMRGVLRRTRLALRASALLPAPWERACHRLEAQGRLPARVRILATEDTRMPMTWGVLRPIVLVPAWSDWSDEERDAALLHELAHVQRGDALALTLMTVARALHWFNPIAWWLTSAERLAREEACDDLVLEAGVRPSLYAEQLLAIVSLPGEERPPAAALAMARSSSLARRLCAILQPTQPRDFPGTGTRLALALAAMTLSACVGTITPVARVVPTTAVTVDASASMPPGNSRAVEIASPAGPAQLAEVPLTPGVPTVDVAAPAPAEPALGAVDEADVPAVALPALAVPLTDAVPTPMVAVFPARSAIAPAPQQMRCEGRRSGNSTQISSSDDDGRRKVVWKQNGCELELQTRGEFTLAPALDDVRSISSGGYVQLREDDGKVERQVRITPGSNGALQYDYRVDGDRRPWDAEGRAWFGAVALRLDRRLAWAVDVRVPALLQSGGVEAVLAEIEKMEGDYARRVYFTVLAKSARLSSAQLVRVVESAAAKIDSDYEMAELLIAVGKQLSFDEPAQRALARATSTIDSDYERRRALGSLLQRDGLSTQTVGYMLEATRGMDSDYELAELLIAISSRYALAPATQQYYLDALATIDSDYEYRRVFTAMTRTGPLTAASASVILDHAGAHMGGYELAELLIAIDRVVTSDRTLGTPFLRALRRVDSGYEKARVMKHLVRQSPDTAVVLQLLADSRTIDSNHERLQFLLDVSRAYRLEGKLREAYLDAAESIDGDYERGQALAAATGRRTGAR